MTLAQLLQPYERQLAQSFYLMVVFIILLLIGITRTGDFNLVMISGVIVVLALFPGFLWATGRVRGFPIAPIICLLEIFLFAIPILSASDALSIYTNEEIARAGKLEILFLFTFILAWLYFVRRERILPDRMLALPVANVTNITLDRLWIIGLLGATIYTVSFMAGWLHRFFVLLPPGMIGLVRSVFGTIGIVSVFFLSLSMGMRVLGPMSRIMFLALLILFLLASGTSLLLSSIVAFLFAAFVGFSLGRGRIPWIALLMVAFILQVLHVGKGPIRQQYWPQLGGVAENISPNKYMNFYSNWVSEGLRLKGRNEIDSVDDGTDLLDRASLIQMILYAQARAPEHIDYLHGRTIMIIPPLLIPRFIWPDKPRTHEGQIILNVHFGRQTIEETQRTYIAWGMLAEFYANFGWLGAILAGILLGSMIGWVTSLSIGVPLCTYRAVITAIFFITSMTVTQIALSIWISSTFQGIVAATLVCFLIMKRVPTDSLVNAEPEEDVRA